MPSIPPVIVAGSDGAAGSAGIVIRLASVGRRANVFIFNSKSLGRDDAAIATSNST